MDSDLAESVKALKAIFEKRLIPANFMPADAATIKALKKELRLTHRYASFLTEADPLDVETVTPPERIRFVPSAELREEQTNYVDGAMPGWRNGWVVIGHSSMLGDPYFLDTTRLDTEGDCPVMTAMTGTDNVKPVLAASNFATFLHILAAAMEMAEDFADNGDPDDEQIFREALAPKVRLIDPAALRAGHWT